MQRPLFWSLILFMFGLLLALIYKSNSVAKSIFIELQTLSVVSFFAVTFFIFISLVHKYKKINTGVILALSTFIILTGLLYGLIRVDSNEIATIFLDREQIKITGTITRLWQTPAYQAIAMKTENNETLQIRIRIENVNNVFNEEYFNTMNFKNSDLLPGTKIEVVGEYRTPSAKRNPGGFDEQKYFWLNDWNGKVFTSYEQITVVGESKRFTYKVRELVYKTKVYYQEILRASMKEKEFAVINALVLGDRGYIDYETRDQIKNLGLSHLFALSGLHVGVIVLVVIGTLDRLGVSRDRTYLFLLLLLPIYALLTGASPSVVRAVIMAELMILANLVTKKSDIFTNIAVAAFLLVLINPKNLLNIGFQLTFIITVGIIIFEPMINTLLDKVQLKGKVKGKIKSEGIGLRNGLRKLFSVTLAAQVFAFPLLVYYFQEFAWSVFLSQFIVLPIISLIILPTGIFMLLVAWIHPALSVFPTLILQTSATVMLTITERLEFATALVSKFPEIHFIWIAIYFVCALFVAYLIYYRRYATKSIATGFVILIVLLGSLWLPKLPTGQLHITLIDVGQGDSIHIETPKGKHMLVDGGGWPVYGDYAYDVGEQIILPYLYARGIKSLDAIFLSHADHDHIHGLLSVIENFPVKSFIHSVEDPRESFVRLMEIAKEKGIPTYQVAKGDRIEVEKGLVIDILHPDSSVSAKGTPNNESMVKEIRYNDRRILLTGDIETEAERLLVDRLTNEPIDILKVAHHGSRTSSTELFLQQVKPTYSAISVGKNNRFGHPSGEVIERIYNIGSEIYRTDEQGAIFFTINKNRIEIKTMIQ